MPDKSGWDSFWTGVFIGDFDREDDSWWKVVGQTLAGVVPVAGQVADDRDTLAAIDSVWEGRDGAWTDLGMAGIGWVPLFGDLAKGGLRVGRKGVKAATNVAEGAADLGKHAPTPHAPDFKGKLRGLEVTLPGVKTRTIEYVKRPRAEYDKLRSAFDNKVRGEFAQSLVNDPAKLKALREAGLDDIAIKRLADGKMPAGYQVHHKIPIDDGGTNSFDNLVLIKNEPYHKTITNAQDALTGTLKEGEKKVIDFPIPDGFIYPPKP
jgi:hypothetical protein